MYVGVWAFPFFRSPQEAKMPARQIRSVGSKSVVLKHPHLTLAAKTAKQGRGRSAQALFGVTQALPGFGYYVGGPLAMAFIQSISQLRLSNPGKIEGE